MTYQALARKWRPKTFAELSGQEHVVRALSNALEQGRLHHAYLLTGTRGVGKTTIARILAKSLNCVRGVTATPCGVCAACVDIDAGRFVDLLELDAASNTGIDNMREILDNARYAPTVGRYKVYLIDEAHMLSKPAFNSMLKTLEEPPEHVKFVLATTDAPKIPVTVLSRCLQFNLKLLPPATIAARLSEILRAEGVAFDDSAVALIARAARGSMRDALSVLDQALAYGAGEVRDGGVRSMLGTVDADYAYRIVDALIARDGPALLAQARTLTERGVSLAGALEELALLLHRIALVQTVPDASDAVPDAERVKALAEAFAPDAVQLAYQICLQGRTDLSLAPDEQTGFSMTLLRLLAFDPATESPGAVPPRAAPKTERTGDAAGALEPAAAGPSASAAHVATAPVVTASEAAFPAAPDPATWSTFVAAMKLSGMALQLAAQTELKAVSGSEFVLMVPEAARHLTDPPYADTLRHAIGQALGRRVRLRFEIGGVAATSLAAKERREREAAQAKTEAAFRDDPFVQDLLSRFDARVKPNSIKPI
ncbi:MAG TPA: DNA polymerase III subunit gamma/tau [Casimicrobiaceae bacterium]|jgi:DNA polymerase-3 subunit gamma/tau|nr:DNA polymerase III subunit gamma/tau [Casimicrobiaceae bacterium]